MRSTKELQGVHVLGGKKGKSKIGRVKLAVFHPDEPRLVGFVIKRPDLLLMFPRSDRFLAFDSFRIVDGRLIGYADSDAWDAEAFRRLNVDFDDCLIWEGMSLVTESGTQLGRIDSVIYDEKTGEVSSFTVTQGASWLVGRGEIPVEDVLRYRDGSFILADRASEMTLEGGAAAKAGERVAETSAGMKVVGQETKEAAKVGAEKGKAAWQGFREKYIDLTDEEAEDLDRIAAEKRLEKVSRRTPDGQAINVEPVEVNTPAAAQPAAAAATPAAEQPAAAAQPAAAQPAAAQPAVEQTAAAAQTAAEPAPAPAPQKDLVESATEAVAKQVEKSKGMFAAFKEEYEKAKNGQ